MKKILLSLGTGIMAVALMFGLYSTPQANGKALVDKPAPDFTLINTDGTKVSLTDFKGKYVVLEWINYDCPFVAKHYNGGNMQALQKKHMEKGCVWLAICSSAPGKQGHFSNEAIHQRMKAHNSEVSAYLHDENGEIGRLYGATNTPNMYIINPDGELEYRGAIDSIRSANQADIAKADNYVAMALDAAMAGEEIKVNMTRAYGCDVKSLSLLS